MIKFEHSELEDLEFVDPHVIQPIRSNTDDITCDQEFSNSALNEIQEDSNITVCGNSPNNIMMEQCINLDLYLSPITGNSSANIADELNTPIFDIPNELNVINIQNIINSNRNPFTFSVRVKNEEERENRRVVTTDIHEDSVVNSEITDSSLLSPNNTFNMAEHDDINLEEYDFLSDYNDAIMNISDVYGDDADVEEIVEVVEPEASENSVDSHHNYSLKLDLNSKYTGPTEDLQTPDVINTICSIAKDFNLFPFEGEIVKAEDILPTAGEDFLQSGGTSPSYTQSEIPQTFSWPSVVAHKEPEPEVEPSNSFETNQYRRKRKLSSDEENDDDDEDYVPPGKRPSKVRRRRKSSVDEEFSARVAKRGRPSKRISVSSDNSESSKYREMRDKNNEASRKSRQKRRVQELTCEKDKDELTVRNIQLKAQVAELEKTVNTFRTNLMQLLMK